jgi:hypothetical protein
VIVKAWKAVMDPEYNSLMKLPKTVRFQLMVVLASLWSTIFCVNAGLIVWLPGYVMVHVILLLIGIFSTGWIFSSAQKSYLKLMAKID